ncbi:tyrosine-type recombinase/integrase [Lysinibacillus sp. NPDC097287]|uniref:tyrosine-type recombinase/integrase n=1 Tax=Lysinibacillus sp. NPDC097287 TaxID=3364144 RepID=UPI0038128C4F
MNNKECIDRFITEALAGKANNTVNSYRYSLERFGKYLDESDTDLIGYGRINVQNYIDKQFAKRSASGVNREIAAIKAYSRYVGKPEVSEGLRIFKPLKAKQQARTWLSPENANEILHLTALKPNKRDHAIVSLFLYSGLRLSEVAALDRNDVNLCESRGTVNVREYKMGCERIVPLSSGTCKAIKDYLDQRNDNLEALFLSSFYKPLSARSIQSMLKQYGINSTQLRHTFVKTLVNKGTPIETVKVLNGRFSIGRIASYFSTEGLANVVDRFTKQ